MNRVLCWLGFHAWGRPSWLETLNVRYHQCQRCGIMRQMP